MLENNLRILLGVGILIGLIFLGNKLKQLRSQQEYFLLQNFIQEKIEQQFTHLHERQTHHIHLLQSTLRDSLEHFSNSLNKRFESLNQTNQQQIQEISNRIDKRLMEGFNKTNQTFTDIIKRLALIDDAQKNISELSSNVVNLQEILTDKRSRGAFGEVQLKNLIENIMPKEFIAFQHSLSNGCRVDCALFLPPPNYLMAIDSKFPLDNYQKMTSFDISNYDKKKYEQLFKQDIKTHINNINQKYIIVNETNEHAIMFIPAEAIFSELHRNYPELIQYGYQKKVWLASPTTMMAILAAANSIVKDSLTQKHIRTIQEHLYVLSKDFARFEERIEKLGKHINQAQEDMSSIHTSAKKITSRFKKIGKAEIHDSELQEMSSLEKNSSIKNKNIF